MNLMTTNAPLMTMGTREIAELLGKEHSHIKTSAERLSEKGILTRALRESDFTNERGRTNSFVTAWLRSRPSAITCSGDWRTSTC